ncbi:MAG TPA: fasciclin domain-containing protein [Candidatus Paceibacterota bacterium]|nr:fasciclin domain-containing protein [Candidatus Paceibacterota bacterium]
MSYLKTLVVSGAFTLLIIAAPASAQTIVGVAQSNDDFSSLVDAVVAQDLVDTLNGEGPFTVFAPTNDAFANLPTYVSDVLADEPELLTDILLYHVVPGELMAEDVLSERRLETALGTHLFVSARDGAKVNSANITATDIAADNGVVHVIDRVLIPQSVYQAVIEDLREQLREVVRTLREVQQDRVADRTGR